MRFRDHQQQVRAKMAAAQAGRAAAGTGAPPMPEEGPVASEYQLLLAALGEDLRQLHGMKETARKIEAKRVMIARYLPWVHGALAAETGAQDEIVAWVTIWAMDIGDWPLVIRLAEHVLRNQLSTPERFKSSFAVKLADDIAEAGLKNPPEVDYETVAAISVLTADHDLFDQTRAQLLKATGVALKARADAFDPTAESAVSGGKAVLLHAALDAFRAALAKDSKCGVKKLIEALEREIRATGGMTPEGGISPVATQGSGAVTEGAPAA